MIAKNEIARVNPQHMPAKAALAVFVLLGASHAFAAPVPYYTASGVGGMGDVNAGTWGGVDNTNKSAALEVVIDFTPTVDSETAPIVLWDAGGSGIGSAVVLDNDQVHYFAGNTNAIVVSGNHGLTATQNDVQIVAAFELSAGAGDDELLSLYVDGVLVASGEFVTTNDWAGGENGSDLGEESGTQRYNSTSLFDSSTVVSYPETNISFAAYLLASSGGPADNTLENIVVPEPSSLALMGLAGLFIARCRR